MKTKIISIILAGFVLSSCEEQVTTTASGGVSKKTVNVKTDSNGWTVEQKNIAERLERDNIAGAIKHLYIISPYSGQVILYSTVKGKVTSSGKRLTPNTVTEGAYGTSCEYIYWFSSKGAYHSHFFTGGQIIHVSDQPLPVKNITINLEQQ